MTAKSPPELANAFPYIADYLACLHVPQGALTFATFESAFNEYDARSGDNREELFHCLKAEIAEFYTTFQSATEQIAAFGQLGGMALSQEGLRIYLPRQL